MMVELFRNSARKSVEKEKMQKKKNLRMIERGEGKYGLSSAKMCEKKKAERVR